VSVNPSGLAVVTTTNVQDALAELDAAVGGASGYTDEQVRDVVAAFLVQGSNITLTNNDPGDSLTIASSGGGGGSTIPYNRIHGKAYTLSAAPNASYPDADTGLGFDGVDWSANKLTDGNWGGVYTSGQNIGYNTGTTVAATFDLGSAATVGLMIARGRSGIGSVYRPVSFKVEHSDDGSTWSSDLDVSGLSNGGQPGDDNWTAHAPITASSHRYWRVTIGRSNTSGHWLFISQVELWG
jgi:hypothetical protein